MSYNHLIVFVKNPILGQVKTRIANTIGNELALKIYQYLMQKTFDVCCDIDCQKYVFYSDFIINDDMWSRADFFKSIQVGTNLGKRMAQAFASVISNKPKNCLLIGSDCPYITQEIIMQSFEALRKVDVVIGPAVDGGYYLLGMKNMHPVLFDNIEWSSSKVLKQTLQHIQNYQLTYALMPLLSDVDTEQDWNKFVRWKGLEMPIF